jgi:hypothetical protein
MSTLAEKNPPHQANSAMNSEQDVEHDEVMNKASAEGYNSTSEADEEFHFTIGKFLAIAVRISPLSTQSFLGTLSNAPLELAATDNLSRVCK